MGQLGASARRGKIIRIGFDLFRLLTTGRMGWMAHRKWKKIKLQPSMLPGPAVPGSCLASFHFRWAIHPIRPVLNTRYLTTQYLCVAIVPRRITNFISKRRALSRRGQRMLQARVGGDKGLGGEIRQLTEIVFATLRLAEIFPAINRRFLPIFR